MWNHQVFLHDIKETSHFVLVYFLKSTLYICKSLKWNVFIFSVSKIEKKEKKKNWKRKKKLIYLKKLNFLKRYIIETGFKNLNYCKKCKFRFFCVLFCRYYHFVWFQNSLLQGIPTNILVKSKVTLSKDRTNFK